MPELSKIFDAVDVTWPAEEKIACGPITLRRSSGGGKRVSAATVDDAITTQDIEAAEARMRDMGQTPLFSLRPGDTALDDLLAARGYAVVDRTNIYSCPIGLLSAMETDVEQASLAVWEPLAIQLDFWARGGIGPDRIAVMERADCAKTAMIGRHDNSPGGTCYVGIHGGVAMMHALEIITEARRVGMGRAMTVQAAQWAKDEGATDFTCLCVEQNAAANALYSKLGMEIVGQYHYRIKES
ncbi:GNAT family N-acetyltransferase [Pseudooceanicola onchidii]|uniref:GNAT family N-acetyltransferase n=1 Tax=Pseudooceanicola onchidii TaxID=2562279 RepID=UPI0010AAB874|nr:GNAT family N-acetyltransferase [Pseudooceanicola onchidii]